MFFFVLVMLSFSSICFSIQALKSSRLSVRSAVRFRLSSSLIDGSPASKISDCVKDSLLKTFDANDIGSDPDSLIFPAKPEFGDYQCNAAMPLGKKLKQKPRDVAEKLLETLNVNNDGLIASMDISGPGFINIRLSRSYLKDKLSKMACDTEGRLGIAPTTSPKKIIVDFSSPNIAKEMHVGHLRSTIIGDSLSRLLTFLGHDVLRLNHVGDWGTQFGMLIHYMKSADIDSSKISDLVMFYKEAKKNFDEDEAFQIASREEVVKLQSNDVDTVASWQKICQLSRQEFQKIYDMLDIEDLEERGESFYNPFLGRVVDSLEKSGQAVESEGALCIFLPGYKNPDDSPMPMIIRKSDGGFLYATTDLAAVQHRVNTENADRVLYVTDVGQGQHFKQVFEAADAANLNKKSDGSIVDLKHVPFGLVQGEDGKKFKTRSGDVVKLIDLLNQAIEGASDDMKSRTEGGILTSEQEAAARVVGLSAVKYADLSMNRESNYRFSFKKMLALNGNTAPYMLYAFARIQGIRRKALNTLGPGGAKSISSIDSSQFILETEEELALSKQLLRFEEILSEVEKDLYPNKICEYLFELSSKFNQFYENCPVIKAESEELRVSRTALCSVTSDALQLGLGLLGIKTLDKL